MAKQQGERGQEKVDIGFRRRWISGSGIPCRRQPGGREVGGARLAERTC